MTKKLEELETRMEELKTRMTDLSARRESVVGRITAQLLSFEVTGASREEWAAIELEATTLRTEFQKLTADAARAESGAKSKAATEVVQRIIRGIDDHLSNRRPPRRPDAKPEEDADV